MAIRLGGSFTHFRLISRSDSGFTDHNGHLQSDEDAGHTLSGFSSKIPIFVDLCLLLQLLEVQNYPVPA